MKTNLNDLVREYDPMLPTHRQFNDQADQADQEGIEEVIDEEEYYERPSDEMMEYFKKGGR